MAPFDRPLPNKVEDVCRCLSVCLSECMCSWLQWNLSGRWCVLRWSKTSWSMCSPCLPAVRQRCTSYNSFRSGHTSFKVSSHFVTDTHVSLSRFCCVFSTVCSLKSVTHGVETALKTDANFWYVTHTLMWWHAYVSGTIVERPAQGNRCERGDVRVAGSSLNSWPGLIV